jgi:hypothetical protein
MALSMKKAGRGQNALAFSARARFARIDVIANPERLRQLDLAVLDEG